MSVIYLLPCPNDNTVEITVADAGRTITCPCGSVVTVPTLREIKKLPRKQGPSANRAASWSLRQGLVVLATASLTMAWLVFQRLQLDTSEFVRDQEYLDFQDQKVMAMDAADLLEAWNVHLNKPIPETRTLLPRSEVDRAAARVVYVKMAVAGGFMALGLALMVATLCLKPQPAKKPRPRKQASPA